MEELATTPNPNDIASESNQKQKSMLEAFENIVELAEESALNDDFWEKASSSINYAARKLKLTNNQTVLLALLVDCSMDNCISLSDIVVRTGCRTTRLLRFISEAEELEKKRYIRIRRNRNNKSYRVPAEVIDSLVKDKPYVHIPKPVSDVVDFFDRFDKLMDEKDNKEISYDQLMSRTTTYLEDISDSHFATMLNKFGLDSEDTLLFIYMAHLFIENNDDNIGFSDIENLYDCKIPHYIKMCLANHSSELFDHMLIENVNEEGYAVSNRYKLTDFAKTDVLSEFVLKRTGKPERDLIKCSSFPEKKLFYNASERSQVEELYSLLSEGRFTEIQSRLHAAGMRTGFCCLFYGAPGTGKTETVYQLARHTNRDIFRVDVDKIKSCWVGESEKNIKTIFNRYRDICHSSGQAPILLFNEADAVLGVRIEGAARSVDKMENSIQNIILQEMETLEGIMIATTNLTDNLDKAFERRFLYKVRFEKPSVETSALIWQSMMPGLTEKDACTLASQFDFSGGEIENVVRKHSVNAILNGKDILDLPSLVEICRNERISERGKTRIGFRI